MNKQEVEDLEGWLLGTLRYFRRFHKTLQKAEAAKVEEDVYNIISQLKTGDIK